jgi:hypothetical protein
MWIRTTGQHLHAHTATIPIIRTRARHTATMGLAGFQAASSSEPVRGTAEAFMVGRVLDRSTIVAGSGPSAVVNAALLADSEVAQWDEARPADSREVAFGVAIASAEATSKADAASTAAMRVVSLEAAPGEAVVLAAADAAEVAVPTAAGRTEAEVTGKSLR